MEDDRRRLGVPPTETDDLSQDVFAQVVRYLPRFEGRADFRTWLTELASSERPAVGDSLAPDSVDLFALVGQFTALRHEVNMQTRAARTAVEQNAEAGLGIADDVVVMARGEGTFHGSVDEARADQAREVAGEVEIRIVGKRRLGRLAEWPACDEREQETECG